MIAGSVKVLTVGELSEYLRVHRSTIYCLLKSGQVSKSIVTGALKCRGDRRLAATPIARQLHELRANH
jgi:excisionase family DNA binding protein